MTDNEALQEIERQEKRFTEADFGRGLRLAKSAREYYDTIVACHVKAVAAEESSVAARAKIVELTAAADKVEAEARRMLDAVAKQRSEVSKLRRIIRNGDMLKNQEHLARLKFEEKVIRLGTMPIE